MDEQERLAPGEGIEPEFAGPLGLLDEAARRQHARRLLLRTTLFVPAILASVLTTKAVAATKVIVTSIPFCL